MTKIVADIAGDSVDPVVVVVADAWRSCSYTVPCTTCPKTICWSFLSCLRVGVVLVDERYSGHDHSQRCYGSMGVAADEGLTILEAGLVDWRWNVATTTNGLLCGDSLVAGSEE